jgi:hypothetical protein
MQKKKKNWVERKGTDTIARYPNEHKILPCLAGPKDINLAFCSWAKTKSGAAKAWVSTITGGREIVLGLLFNSFR